MPERLIEVALRVLSCFITNPPTKPAPEDVALLRSAAEAEANAMTPDLLAIHIVERELRRRASGAAS